MGVMWVWARRVMGRNKSEWVCGWREVYRRVERQYQEVFDTVEKWAWRVDGT